MSQSVLSTPHPVLRCAAEVGRALDSVAEVSAPFMTTETKRVAMLALSREAHRLQALMLRVMAASEDVATEAGARSPAAWLAHETRLDGAEARRLGRLADGLGRYDALAAALGAGGVGVGQAEVIVGALDELPADLAASVRADAERALVEHAADLDPKRLRILGRRILEVVAPGVADEHERRLLEADERRARASSRITTRRLGGGLSRAVVDLPDVTMDLWMTQLQAYASPRRAHLAPESVEAPWRDPGTGERVPYPRLLAQAFATMIEHTRIDRLPQHGGSPVSLLVTLELATLESGLGVAELSSGGRVSAGEARRLACNAAILPVVLGGRSELLDLGRGRRVFSPAQRRAMALRDGGCRAEGCDIPAAWTEAHHWHPWSRGGKTDLADGVLLCSFHHHRVHDRAYDFTRLPHGDVRFHRRL